MSVRTIRARALCAPAVNSGSSLFAWVATFPACRSVGVSRPDLIGPGTVLTAVKDASRRSAVAFGHP
jgi:hypothetical protein